MSRRVSALSRPAFRRLVVAWVCTNLADSALYLMLAVWVRQLTGSDSAAALVFVALGAPALLAPVAGQVADRVSRRRLLALSKLVVVGCVVSLLLVRDASLVPLIYAVAVVYGTVAYITASAQSGLLRDLLDDEELPGAVGLLTSVDQGLRLISPLIGAGLFVLAGPVPVVVLTAACFAAAAILILTLKIDESPPQSASERGGYWHEISGGFRVLFTDPLLRHLTIAVAIAFAVTGVGSVVVFPMLEEGVGVGSEALGVVVALQGIGAVAGGISAARLIHRRGERSVAGLGLLGIALGSAGAVAAVTVASGVPGLALLGLALAVLGFGVSFVVVSVGTYRMRVTPAHLQGRASAAMNLSLNAPQTAVTLFAAGAILLLDYRMLLGASAAIVLITALTLRPWSRSGSGVQGGVQLHAGAGAR